MWSSLKNSSDAALLFVRAVLGLLFLCFHAWPKLYAQVVYWGPHGTHHAIGQAILHTIVAIAESLASVFLILGLWTRPACLVFVLLIGNVLFTAMTTHGGIAAAESIIELFLLLVVIFFAGPGRFSFDKA